MISAIAARKLARAGSGKGVQLHLIRCILSDVMAFDLIVLGRQLARIGETVMRGQAPPAQPTIAGMVLADVFAHPGSSISEITARTGMPQSHVSETVARLVQTSKPASRAA